MKPSTILTRFCSNLLEHLWIDGLIVVAMRWKLVKVSKFNFESCELRWRNDCNEVWERTDADAELNRRSSIVGSIRQWFQEFSNHFSCSFWSNRFDKLKQIAIVGLESPHAIIELNSLDVTFNRSPERAIECKWEFRSTLGTCLRFILVSHVTFYEVKRKHKR